MKIDNRFTYSDTQLRGFAQAVLDHARQLGASACECDVSEGFGLSVTVRKGSIDTLEHNRDKGIGVSVHFGTRPHVKRGHASTSDFSPAALRQTEIDEIYARIEAANGKEVPKVQYTVGEEVKINDGPFANLNGRIDEIDPARGKLKISVSIFGRFTPVELEYWQVQRASES